jgi:c-di-GMP-binding flagellar brake protein YcgR
MSFHYETARRDFIQIQTDIPIRFKYLSKTITVDSDAIVQGTTTSVSGHGLLLVGKIPDTNWVRALLTNEIVIGLNILLPAADQPVKALATVSWLESFEAGTDRIAMGLKFTEISKEHQDELLRFVIKTQITH